ncbi:Ca2+-binding RTX toxin-like protein [Caulobacter ginsengisoli]|uniref:Ca2+-binding RTX toxin-like protein n=1 Tax=Caulobacter ginsengisoli TaxID=400775 RepID=A0ABU0IPS9_9CAUL|nr:calcium-binding protein [Caulobacter ginsengisoli]MDQ0463969.1 Ca2+-binding RTX toxin-like protein [Caulobacter ginsengisoli]
MSNFRGTAGNDSFFGTDADDIAYGFAGDDQIQGNGGNDTLVGHEGNDTLNGGAGDDWLVGGAGADQMNGGEGNDWISYEDATSSITFNMLQVNWQDTGGGGTDRIASIENIYGSIHDDSLFGDNGANTLSGQAGNDTLVGRLGDDVLNGGAGHDWLVGGEGADQLYGGDGVDWASYEDAARGVTVNLTLKGAQNTIGAGTDILGGIERLYGSAFADTLTGDAAVNLLQGAGGDDSLTSVGAGDTLDGGEGNDRLYGGGGGIMLGGNGSDTLITPTTGQGFVLDLAKTAAQVNGGVSFTLNSIENIQTGSGNDTLYLSAAANTVGTGAGNDKVIYRSLAEIGLGSSADHFIDVGAFDVIDLSAIDANTKLAGNQAFTGVTAFNGQAGQMVMGYDLATGVVHVQFDVNGDKLADAELWLHGSGALGVGWVL